MKSNYEERDLKVKKRKVLGKKVKQLEKTEFFLEIFTAKILNPFRFRYRLRNLKNI